MIGEERMEARSTRWTGSSAWDPKNTSLAIMQFDDQILDVCNRVSALIDMMKESLARGCLISNLRTIEEP